VTGSTHDSHFCGTAHDIILTNHNQLSFNHNYVALKLLTRQTELSLCHITSNNILTCTNEIIFNFKAVLWRESSYSNIRAGAEASCTQTLIIIQAVKTTLVVTVRCVSWACETWKILLLMSHQYGNVHLYHYLKRANEFGENWHMLCSKIHCWVHHTLQGDRRIWKWLFRKILLPIGCNRHAIQILKSLKYLLVMFAKLWK